MELGNIKCISKSKIGDILVYENYQLPVIYCGKLDGATRTISNVNIFNNNKRSRVILLIDRYVHNISFTLGISNEKYCLLNSEKERIKIFADPISPQYINKDILHITNYRKLLVSKVIFK